MKDKMAVDSYLTESSRQTARHVLTALVILFFVIRFVSLWVCDIPHLVTQFDDDAFYYLKIARNTVDLHYVSFDGHNATNGFHPLWLFLVLPVFFFFSDPIICLRIVGSLSVILLAIGYLVAWRYLLRRHSLVACSVVTVLGLYYAHLFSRINLEISAVIPLAVGALTLISGVDVRSDLTRTGKRLLVAGTLLALVQLARLDAVFFNAVIVLYLFIENNRPPTPTVVKHIALLAVPPFITGVVYLSANYAWFGHVVPVSGVVKSMGGHGINHIFLNQMTTSPPWLLFAGMVIMAACYLILRASLRDSYTARSFKGSLSIADISAIFLLVYTAYHLFVTSWLLWAWYTYPALLATMYVVPVVVDFLYGKLARHFPVQRTYLAGCVAALCLVLALGEVAWQILWLYKDVRFSYLYQNYRIAGELNKRLTDKPLLAMGDRAGSLAFFYRGQLLQMEGLVGDYDLLRAITRNKLGDYLTAHGVKYVVSWFGPGTHYAQWSLVTPSPALSMGPAARIRLCSRSEILRDTNRAGTVYVWRWPSCDKTFPQGAPLKARPGTVPKGLSELPGPLRPRLISPAPLRKREV